MIEVLRLSSVFQHQKIKVLKQLLLCAQVIHHTCDFVNLSKAYNNMFERSTMHCNTVRTGEHL